jgi:coenzyme F420-reducing hydrogenase alpha subunit
MKTRKINGGYFGMNTKKQIKCIEDILNEVFQDCKINEVNYSQINKNSSHIRSKFLYGNKQSNYELERNKLLEQLKQVLPNTYTKFKEITELIDEIINNNNNGSYFKSYNEKNGTKYKDNYNLFDALVCKEKENIKEEIRNNCPKNPDDPYGFMNEIEVNDDGRPFSIMPTPLSGGKKKKGKTYKRKRKNKTHKRNKKI